MTRRSRIQWCRVTSVSQSSDDDAKLKAELEKTKQSDVWRNRYQSLLKRYHLIEGENEELKDKLGELLLRCLEISNVNHEDIVKPNQCETQFLKKTWY